MHQTEPPLLLKAAAEFNLDLSRSFVLGDHPHDVEMAGHVGAQGRTNRGPEGRVPIFIEWPTN
jgi:histidinol phosphatase-like enzyme